VGRSAERSRSAARQRGGAGTGPRVAGPADAGDHPARGQRPRAPDRDVLRPRGDRLDDLRADVLGDVQRGYRPVGAAPPVGGHEVGRSHRTAAPRATHRYAHVDYVRPPRGRPSRESENWDHRRIHSYMAIPLATPALIDLVEPNWAMNSTSSHASRPTSDNPGPSWPNSSTHRRGSRASSSNRAPGRLSMPTTARPAAFAQATNPSIVACCRMCWYRSVTIAPRRFHLRLPTMCTSAARNALALRTTVPMFRSCCQFSIATWKSWRRASRSATTASRRQYRYRSTTLRRSPSASRAGSYRGSSGHGPTQGPTPTSST